LPWEVPNSDSGSPVLLQKYQIIYCLLQSHLDDDTKVAPSYSQFHKAAAHSVNTFEQNALPLNYTGLKSALVPNCANYIALYFCTVILVLNLFHPPNVLHFL